ncbi:MAG: PIN domain-containing protein [Holophagaceae bacterium]|nr:PIN domain-containing protein [Holophagaceae bacterium]
MKTYTLDACAVLAWIFKETGYNVITDLVNKASDSEISLLMHKVNLLEVYWKVAERQGKLNADKMYENLLTTPIQFLNTHSHQFFSEFTKIRLEYGTAFVDTFVATTNLIHTNNKGTIVTSDPAFKNLQKNKKFHVQFFK